MTNTNNIDVELMTSEEFCELMITELERRGLRYIIAVEAAEETKNAKFHLFTFREPDKSQFKRLVRAITYLFYPDQIN
jgi:hypothetical protein